MESLDVRQEPAIPEGTMAKRNFRRGRIKPLCGSPTQRNLPGRWGVEPWRARSPALPAPGCRGQRSLAQKKWSAVRSDFSHAPLPGETTSCRRHGVTQGGERWRSEPHYGAISRNSPFQISSAFFFNSLLCFFLILEIISVRVDIQYYKFQVHSPWLGTSVI